MGRGERARTGTLGDACCPSRHQRDNALFLSQNWHDGTLINCLLDASVAFEPVEIVPMTGKPGFLAKHAGQGLGWLCHDEATKTLIMVNHHVSVGRQALLLGFSKKAKNKQAVGHFGEGMKVGALALLRRGLQVTIASTNERWSFEVRHDENFGVGVLGVLSSPRPASDALHHRPTTSAAPPNSSAPPTTLPAPTAIADNISLGSD